MGLGVEFFGRDAAYYCVGFDILDHYGAATDACSGAYLNIVDNDCSRSHVDVIANLCGLWRVCSYGGKLAEVYVVTYNCGWVDNDAEAMLNIQSVADACLCRDEYAVFQFVPVEHKFCERIRPTFVLTEAVPNRETH